MEPYDLIVIGAGPAGSTAARVAAENGLKVVMLDQKAFPRDKACGGYLSLKTLQILHKPLPNDVIEKNIYGVKWHDVREQIEEKKGSQLLGVTVRREIFDKFLATKAINAGVEFINPAKVLHVQIMDNQSNVNIYTDDTIYVAKKAIIAEGVNSVLSQQLGFLKKWRRWQSGFTFTTTVKCHHEIQQQIEPIVEFYRIPFLGGLGWIFPLKEGYNIGVGGWVWRCRDLYQYYNSFLEEICLRRNIEYPSFKPKGSYVPAGGFPRYLGNRTIVLAGDCGGFVDPFAGEGIYYAIKSGEIAGRGAVQSIKNKGYRFGQQYRRTCKQTFYLDFYLSLVKTVLGGTKRTIYADTKKADKFLTDVIQIMKSPHYYRKVLRENLHIFSKF